MTITECNICHKQGSSGDASQPKLKQTFKLGAVGDKQGLTVVVASAYYDPRGIQANDFHICAGCARDALMSAYNG